MGARVVTATLVPKNPLYVQMWRERLRISIPGQTQSFDDKAIVAVDRSKRTARMAAFGAAAESSGYDLIRPFNHPRLVLHEFEAAEALLEHAASCVVGGRTLAIRPVMVVHLMEPPEDGLTDIEERALKELGISAGARDVYLWLGRPLTSHDLTRGTYKTGS